MRADPSTCSATPSPRLTPAEIQAFRDYRRGRQGTLKAWMDTAGADQRGVDAIVYPGLLSDVSLNDGGGSRASFGRRDTPSAANGSPTVIFPVGHNNQGQPINIQLLGRAWDDDKLIGMAYAFAVQHFHERPMQQLRLWSAAPGRVVVELTNDTSSIWMMSRQPAR